MLNEEEKDKYVGILVSESTRNNWKKFAIENNLSTTSNLVRKAVNFYIEFQNKLDYVKDFSKISHELKEPLTSIKGFAQLLIDNHKQELSWDALIKVKEIIDNSELLENKIKKLLENQPLENNLYDILIVDDEESTTNLLRNFFENKGYSCKEIFYGNGVFEFLAHNKPKLILLDILLPDKNGNEICKILKFNEEFEKFKNMPIFYITAVPESEVIKLVNETGANGYFLKPFNFRDFEILFKYL